ncbi:MAG: hypothetical protein ABIH72_00770 [archaeon]
MSLRNILIGGALIFSCVACGPAATVEMKKETNPEYDKSERYDVQRVGVFQDDLAYHNKRGIYEIRDRKTGNGYFGISGIGITEVGSHSDGNSSVEDER